MRSWIAMLLLAAAVVGVCGCGTDSAPATTPATTAPASTTTPSGAPGSVSAAAGSAVRLGVTPAQLEEELGKPATPLRAFHHAFTCSLYRISEEPLFVKLRYCFVHGRLKFFATYAVEGSSR
jgi:hypothetical protein